MRFTRRAAGILILFFAASASLLRAEVPPLLQEIADRWIQEGQQWGFTQTVRETTRDGEVHVRFERFDLSRGYERRWQLLKIDGRAPNADEVDAWNKRKNKGKKKDPKSWFQYVDLDNAKVRNETDRTIDYEVPLKRIAGGLFPGDKVSVLLTIDKETRAIEHAQARVDEPFNVALGLAEIEAVDASINLPPEPKAGNPRPSAATVEDHPSGTVSATVNKLGGKRVEYTWSNFRRTPSR